MPNNDKSLPTSTLVRAVNALAWHRSSLCTDAEQTVEGSDFHEAILAEIRRTSAAMDDIQNVIRTRPL